MSSVPLRQRAEKAFGKSWEFFKDHPLWFGLVLLISLLSLLFLNWFGLVITALAILFTPLFYRWYFRKIGRKVKSRMDALSDKIIDSFSQLFKKKRKKRKKR